MEAPSVRECNSWSKLRLMCSYGGHIVQRPHAKSLSYFGGETRLVSVYPTTLTTLSAFISHLSSSLSLKFPFTVKYQLPHLPLHSLVSLSSDDHLQFLFTEYLRLSSSASAPSRIRLFIFCSNSHNLIHHPKTEAWFVDALNSAKILQKSRDCLVGYDGGENEAKSLAESMVLETTSSFGSSSSSSASLDSAAKLTTSESVAPIASEIVSTNSSCYQTTETCHDPGAGIHAHQMLDYSPHFQQAVQFSYYQVQQPSPQQQFLHYQPNHMYPLYYLPVQTQVSTSYTLPTWGLSEQLNSSPQVPLMEAISEPNPLNFEAPSVEIPTSLKLSDEIQPQPVSQCADFASGEIACNHSEFSDDPARIQIYKSQPPPPTIPSQFQNKTKASATLLSDAMAQLQMIKIPQ